MKKLSIIFFVLILAGLSACNKNQFVLFDTPYAYITDESGLLSEMTISKDANNYLTELVVHINVSDHFYSTPIRVEYEIVCGEGMKEDIDFKLNPVNASPLVFKEYSYEMPIQISWKKSVDFDESKDNKVIVRLKNSSLPEMLMGIPGPNNKNQSFIFTKTSL